MSSFNNALSSVWGAVGGTLDIVTDATAVASRFVRKHRIQQDVGHAADIKMFISSKTLELDMVLQSNAEKRSMLNQELLDAEHHKINEVLQALKKD